MSWLEEKGRAVILTLLRPPDWRDPAEVTPGTILHAGQDLPHGGNRPETQEDGDA